MKTHKSPIKSTDPESTLLYGVTISESGEVYLMLHVPGDDEMLTTNLTRQDWADLMEDGFGVGLSATTESGFLLLKLVDVALEISDMLIGGTTDE